MKYPRVLIVGTVPYNEKMTSRSLDAYFHFWDKNSLRQIFSYSNTPIRGHCSSLYQITDYRVLKRWFNSSYETGVIYNYDELNDTNEDKEEKVSIIGKIGYKIGLKQTSFTHLLRGILWRKKYWCTEKLNKWLDEYKPEVVFLCSSDDYFINEIALYVSEKYNIPIVPCIGDDYIFNKHFSINPFYICYKRKYMKIIKKVFNKVKDIIYISDKLRDKYDKEFSLNGKTVYLTSSIKRRKFKRINVDNPLITYFGNIRLGRNNSLCELSEVFKRINENYVIEVYSNELDKNIYKIFNKYTNIKYMGSKPYSYVQKRMLESDITIVVEGFKNKDIYFSRYSLSTKAADSLSSGVLVVGYGSLECGVIEYLKETKAAVVSDSKEDMFIKLKNVINDINKQKELYEESKRISNINHNLITSCSTSRNVIINAIKKH